MATGSRGTRFAAGLALLLTLGSPRHASAPAPGKPDPALRSLVLAEQAFARASVERGMREAFLEFLADDAVIFRPGPVLARPWFEARPAEAGRLSWEPLHADVSLAGDLGFTTGPWQFLPAEGEPSYGHYVTVWRRRAGAAWRVVVDIGVEHPRPEIAVGDLTFPKPRSTRANRAAGSPSEPAGLEALAAAERDFAGLAAEGSAERACQRHAAGSLRLYREGARPLRGRGPACQALARSGERATSRPAGMAVSDSLDLGYVYGTLEFAPAAEGRPAEPGSFLRVWKEAEEGVWELVLDVAVPHPPAPTGP